jgi:hypothetical protein
MSRIMSHAAAATKWKLLGINSILSQQTQLENGRFCAALNASLAGYIHPVFKPLSARRRE